MPRLRLLGPPALLSDSDDVLLPLSKPLAVLAFLACVEGRSATRDQLVDLLWSNLEPESGRKNLRHTLWRLRHFAGAQLVADETSRHVELLPGLRSDRDDLLNAASARDHQRVVALYTAPFFEGLASAGAAEFEDWAANERYRLRALFMAHAESLVREALDQGNASLALQTARKLHSADVDREASWRLLIETQLANGDRAAARVTGEELVHAFASASRELEAATEKLLRQLKQEREVKSQVPDRLKGELVARENEFKAIVEAVNQCTRSGGAHFHVWGPPGIGKTRLLADLEQRVRGLRMSVLSVRCAPGNATIPFSIASELVDRLVELRGAIAVDPAKASILAGLSEGAARLYQQATPVTPSGPDLLRLRAAAVGALVKAVAEEQPLVMLIDDLQWGDVNSIDLLSALCDAVCRDAVVLVTASRSERETLKTLAVRTVPLAPLTTESTRRLLESIALFPADSWPEQFVQSLVSATHGNPLRMLESIELAQRAGLLSRENGSWRTPDADALMREIVASEAASDLHRVPAHSLPSDAANRRRLLRRILPIAALLIVAAGLAASFADVWRSGIREPLEQDRLAILLKSTQNVRVHELAIDQRVLVTDTVDALSLSVRRREVPDFSPSLGFSIRADRIVGSQVVEDSGVTDLFLVSDGSPAVRLTHSPGDDIHPDLSHDGNAIVFASARWNGRGRTDIGVLDLESGTVTRLTGNDSSWDFSPRWNADGSEIAFVRRSLTAPMIRICRIKTDSSQLRCVPLESQPSHVHVTDWKGDDVIVQGTSRQWKVDANGGLDDEPAHEKVVYCRASPSGRWRACLVAGNDSILLLLPAENPERRHVLRLPRDGEEWAIAWTTHTEMPAPRLVSYDTVFPTVGVAFHLKDVLVPDNVQHSATWQLLDTGTMTLVGSVVTPYGAGSARVEVTREMRVDTVVLVAQPQTEDVLFNEDWGPGYDRRWQLFGSPLPSVERSSTGTVFLNNGDGVVESGAFRIFTVNARQGLAMDFEAWTPIDDVQWQVLQAGFAAVSDTLAVTGWASTTGWLLSPERRIAGTCHFMYGGNEGAHFADSAYAPNTVAAPPFMRTGNAYRVRIQVFPDGRCGAAINGVPMGIESDRMPLHLPTCHARISFTNAWTARSRSAVVMPPSRCSRAHADTTSTSESLLIATLSFRISLRTFVLSCSRTYRLTIALASKAHHPRPSRSCATAPDAVPARERMAVNSERFCFCGRVTAPSAASFLSDATRGFAEPGIGRSSATGSSRSVMSKVSPLRTRLRYWPSRVLSSRAPMMEERDAM